MHKKSKAAYRHAGQHRRPHPVRSARPSLIPPTSFRDPHGLYYVYILANGRKVFHVGVTDDLADYVARHKVPRFSEVTAPPARCRLVYIEPFTSKSAAAAREEQLNRWSHARKAALIEKENRQWEDFSDWEIPTPFDELRSIVLHPGAGRSFSMLRRRQP
jgi:putative endonuclease